LYEASGALDIAIPYEPYQSPFSAPADVYDRTARLWGSIELPALAGLAFEGPLSSVTGAGENASGLAGQWIAVNESMSASASAYQAQITGKVGQAYIVNGVKFDGISNGALLEAKGPGYANFVRGGEFQDWFTGEKALINQAKNQAVVANGAPIQWHVADAEAVQALQKLFRDENVTGIKIIYTPALR
jgi:filamentous hemagglutinin